MSISLIYNNRYKYGGLFVQHVFLPIVFRRQSGLVKAVVRQYLIYVLKRNGASAVFDLRNKTLVATEIFSGLYLGKIVLPPKLLKINNIFQCNKNLTKYMVTNLGIMIIYVYICSYITNNFLQISQLLIKKTIPKNYQKL